MELSEYKLKTLRKDGEFIVYRGQHQRPADASPPSILVVTTVLERPALGSLKKIEHEYSFRDELDPAWAARPLTLCQYKGQTMLVLTDPGGEPLDRLLGRPMELTQFLPLAIGLTTALGQVHGRGLIHKDIKPANVLVNPCDWPGVAHGFRHRFAPAARAPGAGTSRVHRRNTALHGSRTNRANESLDRFAERPLRLRRDALRDADR